MQALHVGDHVRIKRSVREPIYGWGGVRHDDTGTVHRIIDTTLVYVRFPSYGKGIPDWSADPTELEIVEPTDRAGNYLLFEEAYNASPTT